MVYFSCRYSALIPERSSGVPLGARRELGPHGEDGGRKDRGRDWRGETRNQEKPPTPTNSCLYTPERWCNGKIPNRFGLFSRFHLLVWDLLIVRSPSLPVEPGCLFQMGQGWMEGYKHLPWYSPWSWARPLRFETLDPGLAGIGPHLHPCSALAQADLTARRCGEPPCWPWISPSPLQAGLPVSTLSGPQLHWLWLGAFHFESRPPT